MAVVLIYDGFSCPDRVCAEQPAVNLVLLWWDW
jgi:hypothetical protein